MRSYHRRRRFREGGSTEELLNREHRHESSTFLCHAPQYVRSQDVRSSRLLGLVQRRTAAGCVSEGSNFWKCADKVGSGLLEVQPRRLFVVAS